MGLMGPDCFLFCRVCPGACRRPHRLARSLAIGLVRGPQPPALPAGVRSDPVTGRQGSNPFAGPGALGEFGDPLGKDSTHGSDKRVL